MPFSLCTKPGIPDVFVSTNRPAQSSRPSRAYFAEGPFRPYARQTNRTLSLTKSGDHSNSISRSVCPPYTVPANTTWKLTSKPFVQTDSVHTIQDALAHISCPEPLQVDRSNDSNLGNASQQVQIGALPPILVLHFKRFLYDAATDGIIKVSKPVQFTPELEIPPGTDFLY